MNLPDGYFLQGKKYRLTHTIGQGGFGITYLGVWNTEVKGGLGAMKTTIPICIKEYFFKDYCYRDKNSNAVKVHSMTGEKLFGKFKEKLIEEANILSAVQHPNIVNVLEVFEENNTAYIVMEYIKGNSLKFILEKNGVLPEYRVIKYTHQIGNALSFLHEKNIVHLDIKPGNILIDQHDNARLIDFGVSKRYDIEEQETSTTTLTLSKGFAAVEQYDDEGMVNFSPAPDIYSLGATMYNLLTGVIPVESILRATKQMLPPAAYNSNITPKTEKAILKAMEIKPKDRYRKINELLVAIGTPTYELTENPVLETKRIVDDDNTEVIHSPVSNHPDDEDDRTLHKSPSQSKRRRKSRSRHKIRRRVVLTASIFLAAFVGYGVYIYFSDITNWQGMLNGQKMPDNFSALRTDTTTVNQTDSIAADIPDEPERDSQTSVQPSGQNDPEQTPANNPQTQPATPDPNSRSQSAQPVQTAVRPETVNSQENAGLTAITPKYTTEQINLTEEKFQDLMSSGEKKMELEDYEGAISDFEELETVVEELVVMGVYKSRSKLYSNLLVSKEKKAGQDKKKRLDQYIFFFRFGELTIVKHKITNKYGAIDDLGYEQIPCNYELINKIQDRDDLYTFLKEDGSADIWDNTGKKVN